MTRLVVSITFMLCYCKLVNCSTADRLDADTRTCGWRTNSPKFADIYMEIDSRLARTGIARQDLVRLYTIITDEVGYWVRRSHVTNTHISVTLSALMQLEMSKDLDSRNCFDHCTFVLAKNNCNAAIQLHGCRPRSSNNTGYIKSMLDTKVFSLIDRCQVPLMYQALHLNATEIPPQLFRTVRLIAERMVDPMASGHRGSIEDIIVVTKKPFFNTRRLIRPSESGFFEQITSLMIDLERLTGGNELQQAIESGVLMAPTARSHFYRLVVMPCVDYIYKMHTAMDAAIFYGRISESDAKRFSKLKMTSAMRINYFELVRLYEACVFLDNARYTINWRYEANLLLHADLSTSSYGPSIQE